MTVKVTGGRKSYEYRDGGSDIKVHTYQAAEIIDIPFMLKADGVSHIDPVQKLKGPVGLSIALERFAERFFANGGMPPMALVGAMGSPAAAKRASKDVAQAVRDANDDRSNFMTIPTGYELKPIGLDPEKSQMEEARLFQLGEIARMYSLPPVFLQDLTHGTYSNTEQQDLHFVKHTLTTWLEAWEQEMNLKLFPQRSTRFVEFNVDALLRGDFVTRMAGYATGIQNSIITPDEARSSENRPAKGGQADELQIQGATVPLNSDRSVAKAAPVDPNKPATKDPVTKDAKAVA